MLHPRKVLWQREKMLNRSLYRIIGSDCRDTLPSDGPFILVRHQGTDQTVSTASTAMDAQVRQLVLVFLSSFADVRAALWPFLVDFRVTETFHLEMRPFSLRIANT